MQLDCYKGMKTKLLFSYRIAEVDFPPIQWKFSWHRLSGSPLHEAVLTWASDAQSPITAQTL